MLLRALARRPTIARRALNTTKSPDPKPHTMAAVGATAGTLGSLAGMGGGFVAIPLMTRLGVSQHVAHGTSLVGVVCTGAAGAAAYAANGAVDVQTAGIVAATGALTAAAGARAAVATSAESTWRRLQLWYQKNCAAARSPSCTTRRRRPALRVIDAKRGARRPRRVISEPTRRTISWSARSRAIQPRRAPTRRGGLTPPARQHLGIRVGLPRGRAACGGLHRRVTRWR